MPLKVSLPDIRPPPVYPEPRGMATNCLTWAGPKRNPSNLTRAGATVHILVRTRHVKLRNDKVLALVTGRTPMILSLTPMISLSGESKIEMSKLFFQLQRTLW